MYVRLLFEDVLLWERKVLLFVRVEPPQRLFLMCCDLRRSLYSRVNLSAIIENYLSLGGLSSALCQANCDEMKETKS